MRLIAVRISLLWRSWISIFDNEMGTKRKNLWVIVSQSGQALEFLKGWRHSRTQRIRLKLRLFFFLRFFLIFFFGILILFCKKIIVLTTFALRPYYLNVKSCDTRCTEGNFLEESTPKQTSVLLTKPATVKKIFVQIFKMSVFSWANFICEFSW